MMEDTRHLLWFSLVQYLSPFGAAIPYSSVVHRDSCEAG